MAVPATRNLEVIEAGCKTVIGSRFKQSGMIWRGANAILAPRCRQFNGRFEDYRAAQSTPVAAQKRH